VQDPLSTWYKGRTILIGDAAHSMLPLQGQGASQSIEDAEALGHFFRDITAAGGESNGQSAISTEDVERRLAEVFEARFERASLIQQYSRQAANPATAAGSSVITM
jgi:salicylate hydroxylase